MDYINAKWHDDPYETLCCNIHYNKKYTSMNPSLVCVTFYITCMLRTHLQNWNRSNTTK